jgi:hypothetical protein
MKTLVAAVLTLGFCFAGAPAYADHDYGGGYECMSHECGGDDWGGGSDGNTGYDGEGGRSGDTYQDGDGNCRNFCFYGIPAPEPGGGGGR